MEPAGFRIKTDLKIVKTDFKFFKTDLKFVKTDFIFFTNGPNGSL